MDKLPGDLFDEGLRSAELRREGDVVFAGTLDNERAFQFDGFPPAYRKHNQCNDDDQYW